MISFLVEFENIGRARQESMMRHKDVTIRTIFVVLVTEGHSEQDVSLTNARRLDFDGGSHFHHEH